MKIINSKIGKIIYIISVLIILYSLFILYKTFSFGDFTKGEFIVGLTKFRRDSRVTCDYGYSYKLESADFNDAMFYKTVKVKPNTPYKLTCMVKTDSVITEDGKVNGGAQISILDSLECSRSVIGTNDWQKLEFIFDSKDRESVDMGFRLGGNSNKARGTAWFSDFKLEEGLKDHSNNWNVACFIIKNVDVNIDNKNLKVSMNVNDIEKMKLNMDRFKIAANELSNKKMTVDYDIYEINEPIKTITYSEQYGYYLDPSDVEGVLKDYLDKEEYDYIFVTTRLGDMDEDIEIPVYDWIGLRRDGFIWNRLF